MDHFFFNITNQKLVIPRKFASWQQLLAFASGDEVGLLIQTDPEVISSIIPGTPKKTRKNNMAIA